MLHKLEETLFFVKFKKHTDHGCRLQAFSIIIEVYFHELPRPSFY